MKYKPRPYQAEASEAAQMHMESEGYGLILQSPTSSGKTFMSSSVTRFIVDNYGKAFFFVHSKSLFRSTHKALSQDFEDSEICLCHSGEPDLNCKVFVFMAQTFTSRMDEKWSYLFDHIACAFFDECHLAHFDKIALKCKELNIRRFGMTATPKRGRKAKVQLWDMYDHKITTVTEMELILNGWTVPPYPVLPEQAALDRDILSISRQAGGESEYKRGEASNAMRKKRGIYSGVIDNWKKYAIESGYTKTITYCCDVIHTIETCLKLTEAGIKARFICSKPSAGSANHDIYHGSKHLTGTLDELLKGWGTEFDVLVNADMLTTGTDVPDIQAVILLRPILSENLYLQATGRGKRACEAINKEYYLLFDFAGNIEAHGLPIIDRNYPFAPTPKRKTSSLPPMKTCPQCGQQLLAMSRICNNPIYNNFELVGVCGYEFPFERLELESSFTLVQFDKILELDGKKLGDKLVKKKASVWEIYEAWQKKGFKRGWLIHNIMEVHGRAGIEELALKQGKDVNLTLNYVQKNSKYNVL